MEKWASVRVNVETIDKKGRKITLKNVPAERNKRRNITRVDLDEVIKRVRAVERRQKITRSPKEEMRHDDRPTGKKRR